MWVCVYIYIYIYIYSYLYVHRYTYSYICMHACTYLIIFIDINLIEYKIYVCTISWVHNTIVFTYLFPLHIFLNKFLFFLAQTTHFFQLTEYTAKKTKKQSIAWKNMPSLFFSISSIITVPSSPLHHHPPNNNNNTLPITTTTTTTTELLLR